MELDSGEVLIEMTESQRPFCQCIYVELDRSPSPHTSSNSLKNQLISNMTNFLSRGSTSKWKASIII